jgi:PAS domain S-box-containing protein
VHRVLCVDDEPQNRYLLVQSLRGPELEVVTAADGVEALAALERGGIDIVVSDILMPRMDGFLLCRTIKRHPSFLHIPFIMLTASYGDADDGALALSVGADRYLVKPIEPVELTAIVSDLLVRAASRPGGAPPSAPGLAPEAEEFLQHYSSRLNKKVESKSSDLTLANERLRRTAALLEAIADATTDIIFVRTLDGQYAYLNESGAQFFGRAKRELVGRESVEVRAVAATPQQFTTDDAAVIASDGPRRYVEFGRDAAGRVREFATVKGPLRDAGGVVTGIFGVARDVTEERALERAMLDAAEHERQRIGADLHDGLGQELVGISLLLRSIKVADPHLDRGVADAISRAYAAVVQALRTTRSLARGMAPTGLDGVRLLDALEALAGRTTEQTGTACDVDRSGVATLDVEADAALHLYRIVQEAIANAVRHGKARRIRIRIVARPWLQISICDDGRGFEVRGDAWSEGLGLRLMKYRMDLIGGRATISSRPGDTRITLERVYTDRTVAPVPA